MTGRKTLAEVRAVLEAAVGAGPVGGGEVTAALRRFLAAGPGTPTAGPTPPAPPAGRPKRRPTAGRSRRPES